MTGQDSLFDVPAVPPPGRDYAGYTGRFSGADARPTERASGEAVEDRDRGPLKRGSAGHQILAVYATAGAPVTAYEASHRATGDYHERRRESTRLYDRGLLEHGMPMPNPAPSGRRSVDSFLITSAGMAEYRRLGPWG